MDARDSILSAVDSWHVRPSVPLWFAVGNRCRATVALFSSEDDARAFMLWKIEAELGAPGGALRVASACLNAGEGGDLARALRIADAIEELLPESVEPTRIRTLAHFLSGRD